MYTKVFSPERLGQGSTHWVCRYGCSQAQTTVLDHSFPCLLSSGRHCFIPYRSPCGINELQLASQKQNLKSAAMITGQLSKVKSLGPTNSQGPELPNRARQSSKNDEASLVHPNLSIPLHYQSHWVFGIFIFCLFSWGFCPQFKVSCWFKQQQSS